MAQSCLNNVPHEQFWSLAHSYADLVSRLHVQVRLVGNFGLNAGIPWLSDTEGSLRFIRKESEDNIGHILLEWRFFRDNVKSIWSNLKQKIVSTNPADSVQISDFISNL